MLQSTPQPNPSQNTGFKAALDEAQTALAGPVPEKRKRGRPPKGMAMDGKTNTPVALPAPEPMIQNSSESLKPQLVFGFNFVFDSWAKSANIEALRLTEEEALTMAAPTAECLAAYFPQVSGKQLVTAAALFAIASVSYSKYRIYTSEMEREKKEADVRRATQNQSH